MALKKALAKARERKLKWLQETNEEIRSYNWDFVSDLIDNLIRKQCQQCNQETGHHVWKKESGETVHQCKECGTTQEVQENEKGVL